MVLASRSASVPYKLNQLAGTKTEDRATAQQQPGVYVVANKAAATNFREHLGENTPSTTLTVLNEGSIVRVDEVGLTTSGQRRGRTDQGWLSFLSVRGTKLLQPVGRGRPATETPHLLVPAALRCVSDVAVTSDLEIDGQAEVLITRVVTPGEEIRLAEICRTKTAGILRASLDDGGWVSLVAKNGKILWADVTARSTPDSPRADATANSGGGESSAIKNTTAVAEESVIGGKIPGLGADANTDTRLKPLLGRGMVANRKSAPAKLGQRIVTFGYQRVRLFTESTAEMTARREFWQYVQQQAEHNCCGARSNADELEDALGKVEVLKRIRDGGRVVTFEEMLGNKGAIWLAEGVIDVGSRCRNLTLVNCNIADEGFAAICAILRKSSIRTLILDQNLISDAGVLRQRPKLEKAKLQNLSLAQNSITTTGARALGKSLATNARGLRDGSVQISTFVFSMKALRGAAGNRRLNLAQHQLDDLDASFIAGVLPATELEAVDLASNCITGRVMQMLLLILPATKIVEIDISGGSYTIVNCDAAVEGMIEDWIAKSGPSVQVTYGRSPVIKYTGTMHAWGDSPAEERFRQETELRLMSAAGEELVGWAIEVPTARPNGSSSSNIRRIGVVKEYVGFRLFAKSDFHLVDFGGVGRSWGVEEISLQTARDDGLMGMVSFDSKVGWMLVGLPGTARVARAMSPTSPTGSQPDGSLWPRTASVVFEQPTTPPSHRSLIGSRQLSMVSMGSEESQQSSSVESLHAAGSDALAATAQPPPPRPQKATRNGRCRARPSTKHLCSF